MISQCEITYVSYYITQGKSLPSLLLEDTASELLFVSQEVGSPQNKICLQLGLGPPSCQNCEK